MDNPRGVGGASGPFLRPGNLAFPLKTITSPPCYPPSLLLADDGGRSVDGEDVVSGGFVRGLYRKARSNSMIAFPPLAMGCSESRAQTVASICCARRGVRKGRRELAVSWRARPRATCRISEGGDVGRAVEQPRSWRSLRRSEACVLLKDVFDYTPRRKSLNWLVRLWVAVKAALNRGRLKLAEAPVSEDFARATRTRKYRSCLHLYVGAVQSARLGWDFRELIAERCPALRVGGSGSKGRVE